jgi:molybdopterin synthase sulfur carrier subunit
MATVYIPTQMRELAGGSESLEAQGATLADVILAVERAHPALTGRLRDGDTLAGGLAASIDGRLAARGLMARVEPASEIHFLPAIGGG